MFGTGPAWIVCGSCYYRNSASHQQIMDALFEKKIKYECSKCGKYLMEIDKDFIVTPKVIMEDLSSLLLVGSNLTLTYAGSTQHVVFSNMIYQTIFNNTPSIYTWHPKHFLGSTLEKAALELILKNNKIESAKQSLRLSSEGRDPLLFLAQFTKRSDITVNWNSHFGKRKLSEKMIYNENYELFSRLQNAI